MEKVFKKCKYCKYYKKPKEDYEIRKDLGTCICDKFIYDAEREDYPLNDKFEYIDYEGYSASFYVGQNFGCIHWASK